MLPKTPFSAYKSFWRFLRSFLNELENTISFFKRKKQRICCRKLCFRQGDYRFCKSALLLGRTIWDFPEIHFRLTDGKVLSKNFTYPKPYLSPEKNGVFLLSKVFGIFKPFFQKGLKWGMGQRPIERPRGALPRTPPLSWKERGKEG